MTDETPEITPSNCRGEFIPTLNKSDILYMLCLVDLNEATNLEKSLKLKNNSTNPIEYTFDYGTKTPSSNLRTYCLPLFIDQSVIGNANPLQFDVKVTSKKPPVTSTSGTIETVRTSGLWVTAVNALQNDEANQDNIPIRFVILQSLTNTDQYFVVIYVKTTVSDTRTLNVQTSGKKIEISFQPRVGDPNTESAHVVAAATVDSTKEQFTSIVLTDDNGNKHTQSISSDDYASGTVIQM